MENQNRVRVENTAQPTKEFDIKWFVVNILVHWKWFLVSLILCLILGFLYLRYKVPVYNVNSSIILKDSKRGGLGNSELSVFQSMGLLNSSNSNVDNEIEMLRSRNLLEDVVRELRLYTQYSTHGRFKDTEIYGQQNNGYYQSVPVFVLVDPKLASRIGGVVNLKISRLEDDSYEVTGDYGANPIEAKFKTLPAKLETPIGEFTLRASKSAILSKDLPLYVRITSPLAASGFYMGSLDIRSVNRDASVVHIGLSETHRQRGVTFLNHLIKVYNRDAMEDKNRAASNAADFISDRLELINDDLNRSEIEIEEYKKANRLTDVDSESRLYMVENNASEKELVQIGTQLGLLTFIEKEIQRMGSKDALLPATIGITSPNITSLINQYNAAIMEKERLLTYSSEQSPVVIRLNEKIYTSRQGITNEILGIRRTLGAREQEIKKEHLRYDSYISDIPRREREYADKLRQQRIKESLYVVLLEKKEEANLSLAVTAPSAKVIEDPLAGKLPIAPNKMLVMLVAVLVGLAVPLIIFLLKENLNYKIETDMDVKRLTNIPLLASLPLDKKKNPLVVNSQSTTPIAEMFRLLRTNLQFALGTPEKKIVLITSSISGEGKTFVSINLAVTFALKYKTILIGLDIRKPKLANYMNLSQRQGIVSYLNGDITDVDSIIQPSGVHENLDVIAAGPVPPNPNELLMERSLDRLFAELRNKYEYIIVDTSPVGSVSDSFLLDRISDVSLFVLRSKITPKAGINLVNNIYEDNRLKKLQLVLNGVSDDTNLGQYGYGRYGYGYGYGYGYNNEKEGSRKRKKK